VTEILTVQIKDAAGCTVAGRFESGVNPCDLPCEGEAIRLGYRFWLPEARPNFPINEYTADVRAFFVTDAGGNRFNLSADVANVVQVELDPNGKPKPIRTADFGPTVQRWLTAINALVARAVGSDQWLNLEYEAPAGKETTGTLFVDRLQCLDFAFQLNVSFVQGRRPYHFRLGYSSGGTEIADPDTDGQARIPAFNASTSDKCRPDERPVPQCDDTDLKVEIVRDGVIPDPIVLKAGTSGADAADATFFWEIQDGIPSLANGNAVTVTFQPVEPVEKLVRLTAVTEKGCVVRGARLINIGTEG
jgi:hypothetical protein